MTARITVGLAEEHEVYRRGIEACLAEDRRLRVHPIGTREPDVPLDVAVLSPRAAQRLSLTCPVVICDRPVNSGRHPGAFGVLDRRTLTCAQLLATVRAAAAGLRVEAPRTADTEDLSLRERNVLELLADGLSTREIAETVSYSERTIKKHIADLERRFDARSRAQLMARAARDGLI